MTEDRPQAENYDHTNITVLKGLDPVRKRPGMYIGDTDDGTGLHHMVSEVVDNAIDEASQGYCDHIITKIHADGSVSVEDNGRGIPTGMMEGEGENGEGLPGATVIMTILHAGAKFDADAYKASGGLHGVGVSVVNALSEHLWMTIHRDGDIHYQEFRNGDPVEPLEIIGKTDKTGTKIHFLPSAEVFSDQEFHFKTLHDRLREMSYLNPGVRIELLDERDGQRQNLHHEGGIAEYVTDLIGAREPLNETVISINGVQTVNIAKDKQDTIQVEAALQWCHKYYNENTRCYTNNIYQRDGGTHNTGFRRAITRTITTYMDNQGLSKKIKVTGEDAREGLTAILSVKVHEPKFSSQTKDKLVSSNVEGVVSSIVSEGLNEFLEENPKVAKLICDKVNTAAAVREKLQKEKEIARKDPLGSTSLPGKLADCQEKDPAKSELFLVEGESAGGSAKQARDRKFQAILPLKGKILNVQKATLDKIVKSDEIQTLIKALGTGVEPDFDVEKLRYHRVIIMTDADIDGSHIRTLLLTFFYNKMPGLIKNGHLYIAQPPLFKAKSRKIERYLNDERELDSFILEAAVDSSEIQFKDDNKIDVPRISGPELKDLCDLRVLAKNAIESLSISRDIQVLDALRRMPKLEQSQFEDDAQMDSVAQELSERLAQAVNGGTQYEVTVVPDSQANGHHRNQLMVVREYLGERVEFMIDIKLALSRAYRAIIQLEDALKRFPHTEVFVTRGNKSTEERTLLEALDWLLDDARKGITIQRYKGLGEMNADQLRETTMEASERMLRKVKIEDTIRTDRAFEVLMGDEVQPRREFIETEALSVRNLDI